MPKPFYKRIIKRFMVEETFSGATATEDLRSAWVSFVIGFALLLSAALWLGQEAETEGWIGICVLGFFILLLMWAVWPATNLRIVFDQRDDLCLLQKRFYTFVCRTRRLSMQHAQVTSMFEQVTKKEMAEASGSDLLGCLLFFLGPIGMVISGVQFLGKEKREVTEIVHMLVHVDHVNGRETVLAKVDNSDVMITLLESLRQSACGQWFEDSPRW